MAPATRRGGSGERQGELMDDQAKQADVDGVPTGGSEFPDVPPAVVLQDLSAIKIRRLFKDQMNPRVTVRAFWTDRDAFLAATTMAKGLVGLGWDQLVIHHDARHKELYAWGHLEVQPYRLEDAFFKMGPGERPNVCRFPEENLVLMWWPYSTVDKKKVWSK